MSNKKTRWDYIGNEPDIGGEIEEVGKLPTRPEDYSKDILEEVLDEIEKEENPIRPEGYSKDQKWQFYEKLPEELKEAIWSEKTANINLDLSEKYQFSPKVGKFAELVGYVLLGILPPKEFKERLKRDLELRPEISRALFDEADELIFRPVRESLNKLYKK